MMLTARFKSCALAAFLLTACLLLPDTQAKAESISCRSPSKLRRRSRKLPLKTESVPVLTTLWYETVVETIEEPARKPRLRRRKKHPHRRTCRSRRPPPKRITPSPARRRRI